MNLYQTPFQPINSTAPSFNSTLGSSGVYVFVSTGVRDWQTPGGRSVQLAGKASTPYYVVFGSSLMTPSMDTGMLVPSGAAHVYRLTPAHTYIGIASSTDVVVNVTMGYGSR